MTREEIMQMGRQAGSFIELAQEKDLLWLERFANLVAQHEREACAVIAETPISGEQDDITMEAKDRVAKAIRARGQA